ncbi:MAG: type II secretion system F family protein [Candidatus Melainabacteria bacterium]|nr:type II secretion system F family protein [Candidatus Melainabacteria bacterium]
MTGEIILVAGAAISLVAGIIVTRISSRQRQRNQVRSRLNLVQTQSLDERADEARPVNLIRRRKEPGESVLGTFLSRVMDNIEQQCDLSGWALSVDNLLQIAMVLFFAPIIVSVAFSFELLFAVLSGILLSLLPFAALAVKVASVRRKFTTQLPEAIDLMVSVLRTGHSIPRAIQTVAEEVPAPCGSEFRTVLQRMNLGQPLAEALSRSCARYRSYELDLIRRAVSIQSEVGGSLAELLDKTNYTLRQRIRLSRQIKVLTSQSRLTAIIVGLLPIIMALVLNFANPGYLEPLFQKEVGRLMLLLAVGLQILGIFLMRKMSTIKI